MRVLLLIALLFTPLPAASATDEAEISPGAVIYFTNQERVKRGLTPLEVSPELSRAAAAKARDMIESQYYAHAQWERFIRVAGYNYCLAGENLALNYTDAEELVDAWMGSPDHRYNLLKAGYDEIGVAVVRGRYKTVKEATFVVQMFGARCR
ncbi:MAG TPA: CAP domain-containing protein [Pyrinomonadaceae bacterium]|jgi:uncharacterized protein YkwD